MSGSTSGSVRPASAARPAEETGHNNSSLASHEPEHLSDGELDADAPHDPGEAPCPAETAPRGEAPESEPPPWHKEPTETHTTPRRRRRGRPRHARFRVTEVAADDTDDPARATPDPEPIISDPDEDEEESPPSPTRGGWGHAASLADATFRITVTQPREEGAGRPRRTRRRPARLRESVLNTTPGRSSPSPALIPERERQP
ncbi:serine/arginine repetitive matrix protein 1-like [Bacillus rossius redtenbacheri]|uniref:serine/arginine repetitive matrix protein 1-like n=1 Tax=Bacillus rossius redtenbacheri TaxID=93214 RepID=UPI002FDDA3B5